MLKLEPNLPSGQTLRALDAQHYVKPCGSGKMEMGRNLPQPVLRSAHPDLGFPMHQIRLHGPWEVTGPGEERPRSVKMPQNWQTLFGDTAGLARFSRWFHAPTHLDPDERVWLSFAGIGGTGQISLNGHSLQQVTNEESSVAVDLTDHLRPRNQVLIELTHNPATTVQPGGLFGQIALQIEGSLEIDGLVE
jgi:hypothetical protein